MPKYKHEGATPSVVQLAQLTHMPRSAIMTSVSHFVHPRSIYPHTRTFTLSDSPTFSWQPHLVGSTTSHLQVLFYIRLVGDIAGRLIPAKVTRVRSLLLWALVKAAMVGACMGGEGGLHVVRACAWCAELPAELDGFIGTQLAARLRKEWRTERHGVAALVVPADPEQRNAQPHCHPLSPSGQLTAGPSCSTTTTQVPILFSSIFRPHSMGGDVGAMLLVAGFWVLSGWINTCAFLVGVGTTQRDTR